MGAAHFNYLAVPQATSPTAPCRTPRTYDNQTFSSLGVTPGAYEWTWGSGANQNFTLDIGTAVPEPSTWAMMLPGFAGLGFAGYRASRSRLSDVSSAMRSSSATISSIWFGATWGLGI